MKTELKFIRNHTDQLKIMKTHKTNKQTKSMKHQPKTLEPFSEAKLGHTTTPDSMQAIRCIDILPLSC